MIGIFAGLHRQSVRALGWGEGGGRRGQTLQKQLSKVSGLTTRLFLTRGFIGPCFDFQTASL